MGHPALAHDHSAGPRGYARRRPETTALYWTKRGPPARQQRGNELARKVDAVHRESRETYGSPRVCAKLRHQGEVVSPKTVAKVMRKGGLAARRRKKFRATTVSRNTKRIAPNELKRDFTADRPDHVGVTDVTALRTRAGWCFLAAILDLFSRRVVGWAISESNDTVLAPSALQRALDQRRPAPGLLHHSDRGSPYVSDDYVAALKRHGIKRSMSRKGDCWDNAVAESFFASLEHECVRDETFACTATATRAVENYIDSFYNPERLHSTLGYVSPIGFELRSVLHQEAA